MRSSYDVNDVELLLTDITGKVEPLPTAEREKLIQSGVHYCEMLPLEYKPTEKYMEIYEKMLNLCAKQNADAVGVLADKIIKKHGTSVVLVSLARAGIPIGILLKRYIKMKYNIEVAHYAISIIRGRGIDDVAMRYLLEQYKAEDLCFVDGWTGKGAINTQLADALKDYHNVSNELAVVADPAGVTELCGTHEDILIPSSCLNSTVSGLISRTFLRKDIIGENDYHGAVYYGELKDSDLSNEFLERIESEFSLNCESVKEKTFKDTGVDEVRRIQEKYGISDINLVKPSIGETTRVLLRRVPWLVLINEENKEDAELKPIIRLAEEKNVPVEFVKLEHYKAVGIIKELADA